MSLQQHIARRSRAAGFGAFEPGWDAALGPPPPPNPEWGNDDDNDMPWYVSGAPVIGVIGKTLSNIFGNQYQQPSVPYRQTQVDPYNYTQVPTRNTGVGLGLDGNGIRLSDGSHIGWFPIIGVIGFLYVLQSQPFTRRR